MSAISFTSDMTTTQTDSRNSCWRMTAVWKWTISSKMCIITILRVHMSTFSISLLLFLHVCNWYTRDISYLLSTQVVQSFFIKRSLEEVFDWIREVVGIPHIACEYPLITFLFLTPFINSRLCSRMGQWTRPSITA